MTQDEIIRMAREAGLEQVVAIDPKSGIQTVKCPPLEPLERFAAIVAAHEREKLLKKLDGVSEKVIYEIVKEAVLAERKACAKLCKDIANSQFESGETETAGVLDHCAAAIRARS